MQRRAWIAVLLSVCSTATLARAETSPAATNKAPLEMTVKLGARGRPAQVRVAVDNGAVTLVAEGVRSELPLRDAASVEAETVDAGRGLAIGIVRVASAAGAKAGAVLVRARNGKLRVAFSGALDPRGDPGERSWSTIEIIARASSNGAPAGAAPAGAAPASTAATDVGRDVVVALRNERIAVCGEGPAAIHARTVDAQTGELRPYAAARWKNGRGSVEAQATAESPGPAAAPLLRALQVKGVSSLAGAEAPWLGSPVSALSDGDASTAWVTRAEGGGRGELAAASVDAAGLAVRAVAFIPRATGEQVVAATPRSLWLVSDSGPAIHAVMPDPIVAGQRYWIALPQPTVMRCLTVVLDDLTPAPKVAGAQGAALAEVEIYTDLDFGGGIDRLVQELSSGGAAASRAVDLLQRIGPNVIAPLVSAAVKMPPSARARAVRVWAAYGAHSAAREGMTKALDDPDAKVRELAIEGLARSGADGQSALAARVARTDPAGGAAASAVADAAALALARTAPVDAITAITVAWQAGASERPRLREALATACERAGGVCVERLRAWVASGPTIAARAEAALSLSGLSGRDDVRQLATQLIASSLKDAERFEDRWRLVHAAKPVAPSGEIDGWLGKLAVEEERWMLRAASLQVLAERKASDFAAVARKALDDKYPRVRLAAVQALVSDPHATAGLVLHAKRDRWPMVRAAAYDALAHHANTGEPLIAGVSDRAKGVRAAALRALATAQISSAWPVVEERLRHDNEWPEVTAAALQYVRALCLRQGKDAVVALLQRGLSPKAADFEIELAGPAFETLVHLGGDAAREGMALATRPTSPPGLKAMAKRAKSAKGGCVVVGSTPLQAPPAPAEAAPNAAAAPAPAAAPVAAP